MTASVMYPLFAIGGWGQTATTPLSASEVAISAAGAVVVGLLCALAGRRQSRSRGSRLPSGAWIMLLALALAAPGRAAADDVPPAPPTAEAKPAEPRLQIGGFVDGVFAYNFNKVDQAYVSVRRWS